MALLCTCELDTCVIGRDAHRFLVLYIRIEEAYEDTFRPKYITITHQSSVTVLKYVYFHAWIGYVLCNKALYCERYQPSFVGSSAA
jgi:hypothetical protein